MALNKKKFDIWQKQKELLDDRANVIAGKEGKYENLEKMYRKILGQVVSFANEAEVTEIFLK